MDAKALLCASGGIIAGPMYEYHGFKLGRHISGKGTVINYKAADGSRKDMLVLDAQYRSVQKFGTYGTDVPGLANFQAQGNGGRFVWENNSIDSKTPMPAAVTNDQIFNQWSETFVADSTAKANCDIWMTYNDKTDSQGIKGVPAVAWCRAQVVNGKLCDLPNEYQLIVLWACGDDLDEMDPTAASYPDLRLGYTSTNAHPNYGRCQKFNGVYADRLCSSTERDSTNVRNVTYVGDTYAILKNYNCGVVPILEL